MAIGSYAGIVGRPVKEVALITLIHELAHAYTHLGLDIDQFEWNTNAFAESDLPIIEGLAQFYTEAVIDRLRTRASGLQTSFDELLALQSFAYKCHREWAKGSSSPREIVRLSMLSGRKHGTKNYDEFVKTMGHGGQLLDRSQGQNWAGNA